MSARPVAAKKEPGSSRTAPTAAVKKQRTPSPSPPPPTTYRDIPLLSTSSESSWAHHLIRFAYHNRINLTDQNQFIPPLKLNRKQPPRLKTPAPKPGDPIVDRYGRPIKLDSGKTLTWPKVGDDLTEHRNYIEQSKPKEKPTSAQYDASLVAPSAAAASRAANRPLFQKRVRQVHKASTNARRIHNDESQPWVLEDFETSNNWESARTGRKDNLTALIRHLDEGGMGLEETDAKKEEDVKEVESKVVHHAPWIGKLEGNDLALASESDAGGSAQVLFVFDERGQGGFKVVPLRKTYRFMQKSRFTNEMGDEEREKEYARYQKSRDIAQEKFGARDSGGGSIGGAGGISRAGSQPLSRPSSGSSARSIGGGSGGRLGLPGAFGQTNGNSPRVIKKEETFEDWPELRGLSLSSYSSRPRGLVAVSGGSNQRRRGDDDDDATHRDDGGGTYDELDYQEDFADDEERMGGEAELVEDGEAREMEERIKREMAKAGFGEADADPDEDEDDERQADGLWAEQTGHRENDQINGTEKQMSKLMKAFGQHQGGGEEYESDEEENPYASDDSEDEEIAMTNPEEALRKAKEEKEREEKEAIRLGKVLPANTATGGTATPTSKQSTVPPSAKTSRGTTPTPATSSGAASSSKNAKKRTGEPLPPRMAGSGHANVAKRAASGAGNTSRGASPAGSRSPSPGREHVPRQSSPLAGETTAGSGIKRPASPVGASGSNGSVSSLNRNASSSSKRIKTENGGDSGRSSPSAPYETTTLERELIQMVRSGSARSISEVIAKFKRRLQERAELKMEMMAAAKRVLTGGIKGEPLRVKEGF